MKYYIIAGEPSGDLHGSLLIKALKKVDKNAQFRAWGGDLMEGEGASLAKHYKDLAIMGIVQVIFNLRRIFKNFRYCHEDIKAFQPDVLILIDYSGFNLRVAKWAKKEGIRVFYYISPQVWATRAKRVFTIKQCVDQMFVILPFESDFYKKYDYSVNYIGHPLLDVVHQHEKNNAFIHNLGFSSDQKIIALLPGSRRQEIRSKLPVMLSVVPYFEDYQFVVAGAPAQDFEFYQPFLEGYPNVHWVKGETYNLLANSHAALVTSGTATLETALWKVPQIVCYKASAILYHIVKRIIKIEYLSLVNLIMGGEVVPELLQNDLNTENLRVHLESLLKGEKRQKMMEDYQVLQQKLGNSGAADKAARLMKDYLVKKIEAK